MESFFLLCLIPIAIALAARYFFHYEITWVETAIQIGVGVVILAIVYFSGTAFATHDTEIWNGRVVSKERDHGHYIESYSCNCRSVRSGNTTTTHCDTCYRDHYTVNWYLKSTIGDISIDYADWTSSGVYALPNPEEFQQAKVGEHCAKTNSYVNYVKAVPESLFHQVGLTDPKLHKMIPQYPTIKNIYKIDRVIPVGMKRDRLMESLDEKLDRALTTLGRKKQVNINVIIVKSSNRKFKDMLEHEWIGGKKNDVNVVINAPNYPQIEWADAFTFARTANNNTLAIELREQLRAIGTLQRTDDVANTIVSNVEAHYKRKSMADFEYLKSQIEPPTWVIILSIIISLVIGGGLTYFFHQNEIGPSYTGTYRYNTHHRYRR